MKQLYMLYMLKSPLYCLYRWGHPKIIIKKATLNTTRCSGMLIENVIIVGGQDLSDQCEERVNVFIGLNIHSVKTESP